MNSKYDLPIAENHLKREFTVAKPDQVYVGDITYLYSNASRLAVSGGGDGLVLAADRWLVYGRADAGRIGQ